MNILNMFFYFFRKLIKLTNLIRVFGMALSVLLILDALWLSLIHDTINFGTVLPFMLGGLGLITWGYQARWQIYLTVHPKLSRLWRWIKCGLIVWLISLAVFFVWVVPTDSTPSMPPTVIVVLGTGLRFNQPTLTLRTRLETALVQAQRYPQAMVLVTGGVGFHQTQSEAQVMAAYLSARGIANTRLLLEDKSTSTYENLLFSKALLAQIQTQTQIQQNDTVKDLPVRCLIVSSEFHLIRASAIAKKVGLLVVGTAGAITPLNTRYNARLREYFAFISGWLFNEY